MILKVDGIGHEEGLERHKCYTDLFYLCKRWLLYDLSEKVHRPVCDFFVHKDPTKEIEEQDFIKDRLLLDPREHWKTTIDVGDTCQWIIGFPNVKISMYSGSDVLTEQIINMVRNQFLLNEEFKNLFHEFALTEKTMGTAHGFVSPARTDWKLREPTLFASTLGSVSTGGHPHIIKYDDVVTDRNSETVDQLEKTKLRVAATHPLVLSGGYRDFIGTRYNFNDAYGKYIDDLQEENCLTEIIPFGTIRTGESWKIFERKACTLPFSPKSEILFPQDGREKSRFNYKELKKRLKSMGPQQFGNQYLNDPAWGSVTSFKEDDLRNCIVPFEAIPLYRKSFLSGQTYRAHKVFLAWDLAFSIKKQACRTAGVVGMYDTLGRLYILDLTIGRWTSDEFLYEFIKLAAKWYNFIGRIAVEDAGGSQLITPSLRTATGGGMRLAEMIDWLPTTNVKRAKEERILSLIPLIKSKKFFINADLPHLEEFIKEFVRYSPQAKMVDIPDATSRLLHYHSMVDIVQPLPLQDEPLPPQSVSVLGYGYVAG